MAEQADNVVVVSEATQKQNPKRPKESFGARVKKDAKNNWVLYLMFLPVLAFFVIFSYFPMAGILMAFEDYSPGQGFFNSEWIWFDHFKRFFADPYFGRTILNTLEFSALSLVFVFPSSIVYALMLNGIKNKIFKRSVQTAVYMPYFISLVVVCGLITTFVSSDGFIGVLCQKLGIIDPDTSLLIYPQYFKAIIIVSDIWQGIGFSSIFYVAALSSIDPTLYEAAELDGAGRMAKLFHITLPGILPMIMMSLTLKVGTLFSVGYEKIVLLYNVDTWVSGETISSYVYRLGFASTTAQYGYTTAIGLFNSVANLIMLFISNKLNKKLTGYGLF